MIGKVMRGSKVGGLLRYLYGPGKANEHVDPHLVASWDGPPDSLEPAVLTDGRHDIRHLAGLLEQPMAATVRPPQRPVWHCAVRTAPTDRRLTDAEWRDVARDIVARTGLAPDDDEGGCRWVAVRHADDHIHLVVTLARQDGAPARVSNDFYRVGEACRAAEKRLGLAGTAGRDRTAASRPTRGESEKAARAKRSEPPRATLQREVRTAAAGAATAEEFLTRLADAGLLVRPRFSDLDPDVVTGYAVALPGDRVAGGRPVWFGGGKLAADLSWPKLATAWLTDQPAARRATGPDNGPDDRRDNGHDVGHSVGHGGRRDVGHGDWVRVRLSGPERDTAWRDATRLAATAAGDVRRLAATDPAAAADIAHATGRVLSATARAVEGRTGGPLTEAADSYDRAARELYGRMPKRTAVGSSLRSVARLIALTGRASRDETTQVLSLVANLMALAEAVAHLRETQQRAAQAAAARQAAEHLARAVRQAPTARSPDARRPTVGVVHSPIHTLPAHRPLPSPPPGRPHRRKVQP